MLKTAYIHGQIAALERFGLEGRAIDGLLKEAAKRGPLRPETGVAAPPHIATPPVVPNFDEGAGKAPGWFSKLRNSHVPAKVGLGIGALLGGGMLMHEMRNPQMQVTPSAPIAPFMP